MRYIAKYRIREPRKNIVVAYEFIPINPVLRPTHVRVDPHGNICCVDEGLFIQENNRYCGLEVDVFVREQSARLLDVNGKEIFENDLVKIRKAKDNEEDKYVVTRGNEKLIFYSKSTGMFYKPNFQDSILIIGQETPEYLR